MDSIIQEWLHSILQTPLKLTSPNNLAVCEVVIWITTICQVGLCYNLVTSCSIDWFPSANARSSCREMCLVAGTVGLVAASAPPPLASTSSSPLEWTCHSSSSPRTRLALLYDVMPSPQSSFLLLIIAPLRYLLPATAKAPTRWCRLGSEATSAWSLVAVAMELAAGALVSPSTT